MNKGITKLYNDYKKLTKNPTTYTTFWKYTVLENKSIDEILKMKFERGGNRTSGTGIKGLWRELTNKGLYDYSYTHFMYKKDYRLYPNYKYD